MKKLLYLIISGLLLFITGCATTTYWHNPYLSRREQDRQLNIDHADCEYIAHSMVSQINQSSGVNVYVNNNQKSMLEWSEYFRKRREEGELTTSFYEACMRKKGWEKSSK